MVRGIVAIAGLAILSSSAALGGSDKTGTEKTNSEKTNSEKTNSENAAIDNPNVEFQSLLELCKNHLTKMPGKFDQSKIGSLCNQVQVMESCSSEKGVPIYHFDSAPSIEDPKAKKVLAIALIHGDEFESGSVARRWMERLSAISARNHWRVISRG